MNSRCRVCSLVLSWLVVGVAAGQGAQPWQSPNPGAQPQYQPRSTATRPVDPVSPYGQPEAATPRPGVAGPRPMQPPAAQPGQPRAVPVPLAPPWWPLAPRDQDYIDRVLVAWESYGERIEVFESKFYLREFDPLWDKPGQPSNKPTSEEWGQLKYKKPDKGLFRTDGIRNAQTGQWEKTPLHWVCDGNSIFEFKYPTSKEQRGQLIEHPLAPQLRGGAALADGPVPFVFGAKAARMKERYWIRPLPPPPGDKERIWLEAWPRRQEDAAEFKAAVVILRAKDMCPIGIELQGPDRTAYGPSGEVKTFRGVRKQYAFDETVINPTNLLEFLQGDPFNPRPPFGWQKVVEPSRTAQAPQPAAGSRQ